MTTLRGEIEDLLISAAHSHGGKRIRGQLQADIIRLPYGTSRAVILTRLKRAPHLAARVLTGEFSVDAAAIEAGFRRHSLAIYPNTPSSLQ